MPRNAAAIAAPLGRQLTTDEAAAYLGVSVKHVRRLVEQRRIQFLKEGGAQSRVRIYERWCDDYVERLSTPVGEDESETVNEPRRTAPHVVGIDDLIPKRRRFAKVNLKPKLRMAKAGLR